MITGIIIDWFRKHKHFEATFTPGLNVIIGDTASGKSCIIRALTWAKDNRPVGLAVRNWNAKPKDITRVNVIFSDGYVLRERNELKLDRYEVNGEVFSTLKKEVPNAVVEQFRMGEYSIIHQILKNKSHFLLSDSPSEVAKKLDAMLGLEKIDRATVNCKSKVDETEREINKVQKEIEQLEQELAQFPNIEQMGIDVDNIVQLDKTLASIHFQFDQLVELDYDIQYVAEHIDKYKNIVDLRINLQDISAKIQQWKGLYDQQQALYDYNQVLRSMDYLDIFIGRKEELLSIDKCLKDLKLLIEQYDSLTTLDDDIKKIQFNETNLSRNIESVKLSFTEYLKKQGRCPFCHTQLSNIDEIIERYLSWTK